MLVYFALPIPGWVHSMVYGLWSMAEVHTSECCRCFIFNSFCKI